jgi:hypothetical protein
MITKAILALIIAPFRAALSLLPELEPPDLDGLIADMAPIWQFAGWVNNFVPLQEATTILGILLTVFPLVMLVRGTLWVLNKLHITGGAE